MRKLTFVGFLKQYVKELSLCNSYCLKKIDREAEQNYRVVAPMALLAKLTAGEEQIYAVSSKRLQNAFHELENIADVKTALQNNLLNEDFQKVYKTYQSLAGKHENENHTKEMMLKKIRKAQAQKHISNYRIYTDLHLNHGNINDFLTNGNVTKLSLETAKAILEYVS